MSNPSMAPIPGGRCLYINDRLAPSPAIKAMCPRVLPSADSKPDKPENQEHHGRDPQEMDCETSTKENQNEQQRENQ
jgi:hypothetical protein